MGGTTKEKMQGVRNMTDGISILPFTDEVVFKAGKYIRISVSCLKIIKNVIAQRGNDAKPHPKSLSEREGLKKKVSSFGGDLEGANCHAALNDGMV